MYAHRRTKRVSDDDIARCECQPRDGCGADCINRKLKIECTPGKCPCGGGCRNMAFQRRSYAPLSLVAVGRKGYGLVCDRALAKGDFVIEYTGEVLDQKSFAARKERYGEEGQRHYYFMTLSNTETIDAHRKGSLGRFLNHSCEPNCRTEKWQVRGERCIGIFASRDIPAGEELTFDYQFELFDKAQPCFCGAPSCGGVMGGANIDHAEAKELLEQIAADDPEEGFDEPEYRLVDPPGSTRQNPIDLTASGGEVDGAGSASRPPPRKRQRIGATTTRAAAARAAAAWPPTPIGEVPLSDGEKDKVLDALDATRQPENEQLAFHDDEGARCTRHDFASVQDGEWLNDEVINFYLRMIKDRQVRDAEASGRLPKVWVWTTMFYKKLYSVESGSYVGKYDYEGVKRWTLPARLIARKLPAESVFDMDKIIVPLHQEVHWTVCVIDLRAKRLTFYDSMHHSDVLNALTNLRRWLSDEHQAKKGEPLDLSDWEMVERPHEHGEAVPSQLNGVDCGVFMLKMAEYQARDAKMTFSQDDMPFFRRRIVADILNGKIA